jgi:hypothetical protein
MTASTVSPLTTSSSVVIPARWNGPRRYGNGGYSAGVFARDFGPAARVVLRRPVPLDRPLRIVAEGEESRVYARRRLIAEVTPWHDATPLIPPVRPSLDAAEDAAARHPWTGARHALSDCAICSPNRRDGLGVVPGVLADAPELLAAPFHTDSRIADLLTPAIVSPEFVWAALDCPSFPAADLIAGRVRLLGTIAVNRLRDVFVGESLVVVSWTLGAGTRSVRTASALLAPDGELIASAENVWVAPRRRF